MSFKHLRAIANFGPASLRANGELSLLCSFVSRGVRAGLSLTCSLIIDIAFSMINLHRGPHGRRLHIVVLG